MIEDIDRLVGNTLEIKILTTIIPLGVGAFFRTDEIEKATNSNKKRVEKALKKFESFGLLERNITGDVWKIRKSNIYEAVETLIFYVYADQLKKQSKELLGRDDKKVRI